MFLIKTESISNLKINKHKRVKTKGTDFSVPFMLLIVFSFRCKLQLSPGAIERYRVFLFRLQLKELFSLT